MVRAAYKISGLGTLIDPRGGMIKLKGEGGVWRSKMGHSSITMTTSDR